jgi:hypothetical protein
MGLFFIQEKSRLGFAQPALKFAANPEITTDTAKIIQKYFPENDRFLIFQILHSVGTTDNFCFREISMSILQISFNKMIVRGDS